MTESLTTDKFYNAMDDFLILRFCKICFCFSLFKKYITQNVDKIGQSCIKLRLN